MKTNKPVKFLIAAALSTVFAQGAMAAEESVDMLTLKAFVSMSYQERVAVCAKMVASDQIGACASLKSGDTPSAMASKELLTKAARYCIKEKGLHTPQDVVACARGKIDEDKSKGEEYSSDAYSQAVEYCAAHFSSDPDSLGTCAAGILNHRE